MQEWQRSEAECLTWETELQRADISQVETADALDGNPLAA